MAFNRLNEAYTQITEMSLGRGPANPTVSARNKYLELGAFIRENQAALLQDLIANKEHISLFRKIEQLSFGGPQDQVQSIRNTCALLQLKALLKGTDGEKLAHWVLKNKKGVSVENGFELFADLSQARQILVQTYQLTPDVSAALSDIVTCGLGLKGQKEMQAVRTKTAALSSTMQLEALVHWINSEKIPLAKLQLSNTELATIAPHLNYVDCSDLKLNDLKQFIQLCSSAHHLIVNDRYIESLDQLPESLQILKCENCRSLKKLDLSRNHALESLNCSETEITTLDLTNNSQLKYLHCSRCPYLEAPNLSNNHQLKSLSCPECQSFVTLDLSKNLQLAHLNCAQCRQLTSLGDSLPDTLGFLLLEGCRSLPELPELPPKFIAHLEKQGMGKNHYFKVSPQDLEEKPRQVLLNLSEILKHNPMPNIVYVNHATRKPLQNTDGRGMKRDFIAKLSQNLFKEGSHFTSIEINNAFIPTLKRLEDVDAFRTFAKLIGVAATTSSPIPVPFHPSFFEMVLQLKNQNFERLQVKDYLPSDAARALLREQGDAPDNRLISRVMGIEAAALVVAQELEKLLGEERFKNLDLNTFMAKIKGDSL